MKKLGLLFFFLSLPSFALKEYYSLSRSIRSLGMGGAFYGLSDDEYALFYNPAGLSLYTGKSELMLRINAHLATKTLSALQTIQDLGKSNSNISTAADALAQYQGNALYAGAGIFPYFFTKHFAVGLLVADTKLDVAVVGRELDTSVDLTAISDTGLVVGYAWSPFEAFHVGVNAKGIYRAGGKRNFSLLDIAQNSAVSTDPKSLGGTGAGIDFDLGTIYEMERVPWGVANRISLTLNNLLASRFTMAGSGGTPPALTRMVSVGYHTVFEGWKFIDNFHLLVDFAELGLGGESDADYGSRDGTLWKHLNFGVEMPIGRLALRTGFHQGYITAGLGVNLWAARIDFATYGEELAHSGPGRFPSRRFALSVALGMASPPVPVMSAVREVPLQNQNSGQPAGKTPEKATPKPSIDPKLELKEDKPKPPTGEPASPSTTEVPHR